MSLGMGRIEIFELDKDASGIQNFQLPGLILKQVLVWHSPYPLFGMLWRKSPVFSFHIDSLGQNLLNIFCKLDTYITIHLKYRFIIFNGSCILITSLHFQCLYICNELQKVTLFIVLNSKSRECWNIYLFSFFLCAYLFFT